MTKFRNEKWEESYGRKENFIFYPKDEVVKFLNRFIRKRTGVNSFRDILMSDEKLKALDLGCGIGRQTILFEEFGIEGYGVDISSKAINEAHHLSTHFNVNLQDRLILLSDTRLPFSDNYFDFAISDSVLDSMEYSFARQYMLELNRTVKKYLYLNLISGLSVDNSEAFAEDVVVQNGHEEGTIQSYYNQQRIEALIEGTGFTIVQLNLLTEKSFQKNTQTCRFHIVLSK